MSVSEKTIKEALSAGNYVSEKDLEKAEKSAEKGDFAQYLISEEIINRDILGQALAEFFGLSYADLNSRQPEKDQIEMLSEKEARKYGLVVFAKDKNKITIATDNPKQAGLKNFLRKKFPNKKINLAYSLTDDLQGVFKKHYRKKLNTSFDKILKENQNSFAPELIDEIIKDAVSFNASDIHFEPFEEDTIIRFRVDGVLQEAGKIKKNLYLNILNRLKVQSNLRIDEHSATQDGSIRFLTDNEKLDTRISVAPTLNGEKTVLRLLARHVKTLKLEDLGLSKDNEETLRRVTKKPFGMILVVGPTGSGKTTTLYSLLKLIDSQKLNITTIEDPVEYRISGVNQIQVNRDAGITFSQGLRSVARQDPDVIMVGEIRDNETAEIAVNAALTGHLLFSTFHSNDAASAIPRLLDMGVESFLLSSTLEVVAAQRLVRKICESCRYGFSLKQADKKKLPADVSKKLPAKTTLYKGKGCSACNQTGYHGRVGIFEIIEVSGDVKEAVMEDPTSKNIWQKARKQGTKSLFEDGIEKVKTGKTTLEELMRVAENKK